MTTATATRLACEDQPDLFFRAEGDRTHHWGRPAAALCHRCPIRRACIETELGHGRPVPGSVWGGWVFRQGRPTPHPDDADLYAAHYPTEGTR